MFAQQNPPRVLLRGWSIAMLAALALVGLAAPACGQIRLTAREQRLLDRIPFDGRAAYAYLKQVCDYGPRPSGSEGMQRQQDFIKRHFEELGARVTFQSWEIPHPETTRPVELKNMIVEFHPDRRDRILICCHYDTRPYPDQDPINPRGRFIGANDGASGVGLLCELGKHMGDLPGSLGVDFVFFDAEEFVFDARRDPLFVGSIHFSNEYAKGGRDFDYRWGILVDMIGDASLQLYMEENSMHYATELTRSIWNTARRMRVSEFILQIRHKIRDDHIPLNEIARIPTTDIIDFDYPSPTARYSFWHTQDDTPDKCSPVSLAKVGWVLLEWLKAQE